MIATGVLFDVDGVLIDSGSMYAATWGAWADLRAVDKTLMFEGIHGERGIDTVARVAPELVAEIELELLTQLLGEHEHKAAAFPGAAELLETHAGRCGLVTSAPRPITLARFERLGLPIPDIVVCGEDVSRGKPDPEPYLLGCELLGVAPSNCIVVEDAPAGIAAGKAAGCHVLAVSTGAPVHDTDADEVFEDLVQVSGRLAALLPPR
jgi:mannitol-1-/sugar-/sorbitol-6-phosphatase